MTDTAHAGDGETATTQPDVLQQIRTAILSADFAPHQRLIEADLSERFDASRAAVRAALMTLANEGLVERLPNRGARVRAITVEEAVEIAEVRLALETLCARRAAVRLTDAGATRLRTLRTGIADAVAAGEYAAYSRLNQEMDQVIWEESGHTTATHLLERMRAQSARHQFRLAFLPNRAATSAPQHLAIIDAVLSRDPDAAEAATVVHLQSVIDVLRTAG